MEATLKDWLGSVWKVMIHPSPMTFVNEAQKAKGKTSSAIAWLLLQAVVLHLFNYLVFEYVFDPIVIIVGFIVVPLEIFFLIFWLDTLYRKFFHRKTSYYDAFLYLAVVISIVSQILFSLLNLIPVVRGYYLLTASYLYPIVLLVVAVQSLTQVKVWQSIVIVVLSTILALIGLACVTLFLLMMTRRMPGIY